MSNKVCWSHDGFTFKVYSNDVLVLEAPLAVLSAAPATLLGKDPATGLPAFCPPPTPSAPVPTPPMVVPLTPIVGGTDPCVQARCGAALAMTQHLQDLYDNWRTWVNGSISALGAVAMAALLDWIAAFLAAMILAEASAGWLLVVFNAIRGPWSLLTGAVLSGVLRVWDSTTVDNVQRTFFAALQCAGGSVTVTAGDMTTVAGFIRANPANFLGGDVAELLALSCEFSALADWQAIITSAAPSNLCNGY